jgi:hypothetical protein
MKSNKILYEQEEIRPITIRAYSKLQLFSQLYSVVSEIKNMGREMQGWKENFPSCIIYAFRARKTEAHNFASQ